MKPKTFDAPAPFKESLEQRLRNVASGGANLARRRQLVVFDRFLARVDAVLGDAVILKGGLVLELRLQRARTTNDIDLRLVGSPKDTLALLQKAGRLDLGDFMTFEVNPDAEHPTLDNEGMVYEGRRYRTEARLAGKIYGQPFGVDVVFAEPIVGDLDLVTASDILAFAGIPPPKLRLYPVESHIAEKLHAYTMPRKRENSRVKDLPDLALLGKVKDLEAALIREAIQRTYSARGTHVVPSGLPDTPTSWQAVYARMATTDGLEWATIAEVLEVARRFLDPVLSSTWEGRWSPTTWTWARR